jgi:membrane dipeptidase
MVKIIIDKNPENFFLLDNSVYLANLPGQNLIGIALGMENGAPIEGNLGRVKYFFDKGIRYITLTHSKSNHISDSSYDENKQWGGLSAFGQKLIGEMNNIGMIIDISHVSDDAFMQVLEISKAPVIASHSSLRHYTPGWERNVSDEMLIALANNGGVLQINFGSKFINYAEKDDKDYNFATISQTVDHFDRAISLVGVDHVGIGSDFDGVGDTLPIGLKDASSYPNLIEEFLKRGYSQSDIQKILGGNTLRVWREVENYARKNTSD